MKMLQRVDTLERAPILKPNHVLRWYGSFERPRYVVVDQRAEVGG